MPPFRSFTVTGVVVPFSFGAEEEEAVAVLGAEELAMTGDTTEALAAAEVVGVWEVEAGDRGAGMETETLREAAVEVGVGATLAGVGDVGLVGVVGLLGTGGGSFLVPSDSSSEAERKSFS